MLIYNMHLFITYIFFKVETRKISLVNKSIWFTKTNSTFLFKKQTNEPTFT